MKKLTYVLTGSVFLGAQILALDLGIAKLSFYRLMILLISGMMIMLIFKNDYRLSFSSNLFSKNYTRFYFFWLLYALISVIWIQDITGWIKAVFFIGCGFLSISYLSIFIREERDIVNLFKTIFSMTLLHNILGWLEIVTGNYQFADLNKLDKYNTFATQPSTRIPISIYANQNDYATMLLAGITVAYILYKNNKKTSGKIIYAIFIISTSFLLYKTDSRANIIALLIGIATLFAIKYQRIFSKKIIIRTVCTMIAAFLLVIIFNPSIQDRIISSVTEIKSTLFSEGNSNATRINLIKNGFIFLIQSFGLGTGAGNIEYMMGNNAIFSIGTITNMHNWWMEILTGYGIIIFVLYLSMYFFMVRQLFNNYKYSKNKFIKTTSWILIGYMTSFILSSISSASNILIEWQWVFWGVIITFIRFSERYAKKIS